MFIHDLFYIIDKTDLDKETKKEMYEVVRNILKYYRKMEIKNDVYELMLNIDKVDEFLYSKGCNFNIEIDDILAISKVEEYIDERRVEDEDEDTDDSEYVESKTSDTDTESEFTTIEYESSDVEKKSNPCARNWMLFYVMLTSTLSIGINGYLLMYLKNQ